MKLSESEREKFLALGGVKWLRSQLEKATIVERYGYGVSLHEQHLIAMDSRPAKLVARDYRIAVATVHWFRRKYKADRGAGCGMA